MHRAPPLRTVSTTLISGREDGHLPRDFISAVQTCTSSSISSGATTLLFHVDCHRGFEAAAGWPLARPPWFLFLDACPPLLLNREKSGILRFHRAGVGRACGCAAGGWLLCCQWRCRE